MAGGGSRGRGNGTGSRLLCLDASIVRPSDVMVKGSKTQLKALPEKFFLRAWFSTGQEVRQGHPYAHGARGFSDRQNAQAASAPC